MQTRPAGGRGGPGHRGGPPRRSGDADRRHGREGQGRRARRRFPAAPSCAPRRGATAPPTTPTSARPTAPRSSCSSTRTSRPRPSRSSSARSSLPCVRRARTRSPAHGRAPAVRPPCACSIRRSANLTTVHTHWSPAASRQPGAQRSGRCAAAFVASGMRRRTVYLCARCKRSSDSPSSRRFAERAGAAGTARSGQALCPLGPDYPERHGAVAAVRPPAPAWTRRSSCSIWSRSKRASRRRKSSFSLSRTCGSSIARASIARARSASRSSIHRLTIRCK